MPNWKPFSSGEPESAALSANLHGFVNDASKIVYKAELRAGEHLEITHGVIPTPNTRFGEHPTGYCVVWRGGLESPEPATTSKWFLQRATIPA